MTTEQQPILVQTPGGLASFPAGTDPAVMEKALADQFPSPARSHERAPKRPEQILAESDPDYMGADPSIGKRALQNLPTIAAGAAAMASGPGVILPAIAAGGAGYLGARLRGDSREDAATVGLTQGALEGAGGAVLKGGRMIAHGLMRGTVPKNIAKDFNGVDIAGEMLDRGVVPGSARSAKRVEGLSKRANATRDTAAATVPVMPRRKVVEGLRPMHAKGVKGRVPEMSDATLEQMRKSAREIGPKGLDGPSALARKDIKQAQGNAALNSSDPRTAAFGAQLADAERGAIVSHLRDTPAMRAALDESQAMMALDQVMKDAAHSNPVTRARIGGMTAAAMSPIGLGLTAHGVNQGRQLANPQLLRLIDLIMNGGEQ